MNYSQAKERTLKLLDEYGTAEVPINNELLKARLPMAIDMAQKELSKVRRCVKRVFVRDLEKKLNDELAWKLPKDFVSIRRVWKKTMPVACPRMSDGYIYTQNDDYELEYISFPEDITEDTEDAKELALPLDVCEALPYLAAMILAAGESGVEVSGLRELYNMIMSGINTAENHRLLVVKNA